MCLISVRGNLSPLLERPPPFLLTLQIQPFFFFFLFCPSLIRNHRTLKAEKTLTEEMNEVRWCTPPPSSIHVRKRMKGYGGGAKFAREENFSCVLVGKKSSGAVKEGKWKRSGMLEKHGGWDAALLL